MLVDVDDELNRTKANSNGEEKTLKYVLIEFHIQQQNTEFVCY